MAATNVGAAAAAVATIASPSRCCMVGSRRALCVQNNGSTSPPSRLVFTRNSRLGFFKTELGFLSSSRKMALPVTVCIGDLHGYSTRLRNLWRNLELHLGSSSFSTATIIFLGDYCDRGPDTAGVLDFLVSLPSRFPQQKHIFLAGNHDFGFSSFLGLLAAPPGFQFSSTWDGVSDAVRNREGWWTGHAMEDIHIQGRRWAGRMKDKFNVIKGMPYRGSIYDAEPTFNSYGVEHGDREGLMKAVPESHKKFLQDLVWIHEQAGVEVVDNPSLSYSKLVAVHAGLDVGCVLEDEIALLKRKDPTRPKLESLSGRKNVWNTHKELEEAGALEVSGHHGKLHLDRYRLIIDESGGMDHLPMAAVVLPSRTVIRDTDDHTSLSGAIQLKMGTNTATTALA